MKYHQILRFAVMLTVIFFKINGYSQSYVTYNHDDSKMNQITVQELGAGSLTPEFYYWLFHENYKSNAAEKNKLIFRSAAGVAAYPQIDDADSVETALKKRAEIEALNMVDRQTDLAWLAEGSKITAKLDNYQRNINRIIPAGGTFQDKERWIEYLHVFESSVRATQDAYMPNAQRKKEYLSIYADICRQNETLISYLVMLNNRKHTTQMLSAMQNLPDRRGAIATEAKNRWRSSSWQSANR